MEEKIKIQKTNKMLQKRMVSTVILGGLVPFTLFLLFLYLDWFQILKFNISSRLNYWGLVFFLCLSFILFLSFIHITIPTKNQKKCKTKTNTNQVDKSGREKKDEMEIKNEHYEQDEKGIKKDTKKAESKGVYLKIGWVTLKTSHHKAGNINHELRIGDNNFCCGCYGGALGLILGKIVGFIYLIYYNKPSQLIGLISFLLGIVFILISLTKYIKEIFGWKRLLLNSCLAFGTWLIIIGINIYFLNFYSILYYLIVVPFIGIQRLTLSSLDHQTNRSDKNNYTKL
ncbi:hypothetical protein KAU11_11290 [Candidatus Babeliales bacterium]|nr:hypothetical protein [Candidatus Babeliales bacterium]